jgi:hypothetical protein
MASNDWKDLPKVDFGIWPNQFKKSSKHPTKTGTIEVNETLLKGMLARAKSGEMPILSFAVWPRTSRNGQEYENAQVQLKPSKQTESTPDIEPEPVPVPEPEPEVKEESDGFDW